MGQTLLARSLSLPLLVIVVVSALNNRVLINKLVRIIWKTFDTSVNPDVNGLQDDVSRNENITFNSLNVYKSYLHGVVPLLLVRSSGSEKKKGMGRL